MLYHWPHWGMTQEVQHIGTHCSSTSPARHPSILFMRLQKLGEAAQVRSFLGSPDTCDECLGHGGDGYHPSEVHLRQGHGTRWYAFHCIKPTPSSSFLILSLMFSPGPPFPLLLPNPIVIYVVLWTTANPLRNKVILYLGRATNPSRMDEWLVSYNVMCSV